MSDDPARKDAFRWEVARGLLADLRHEWPGMGEMANEQRRRAAAAIEELMATVEAWQRAIRNNERDIADLIQQRLELISNANKLRAERDEARREVCSLFVAGDFSVHENVTKEHVAFERGWDCFEEKP